MGRKRKGGGLPFGHINLSSSTRPDEAKLSINTFEDVADSEDEFHINRDKILLDEGPAAKRQRIVQEKNAELELSDEEVLVVSDEEELDDLDDDMNEDEEDKEGEDDDLEAPTASSQTTAKGRPKLPAKPLQDSDDESQPDDIEDFDAEEWGTSRKDYYNADINETEQDALEEEAEARRLQQKQLSKMTEADFDLDPEEWAKTDKTDGKLALSRGGVVTSVIPKLEVKDGMSVDEKMTVLRTRYPEFEPLADDFLDLQERYVELTAKSSSDVHAKDPVMSITHIQQRSLGAYLAVLSMYLVLMTSTTKDLTGKSMTMSAEQLHDHSIMGTLTECRDLWLHVRAITEPEPKSPAAQINEYTNGHTVSGSTIEEPAAINVTTAVEAGTKKRKPKKSKAQKAQESHLAAANAERQALLLQAETSLADLSTLAKSSLKSKSKTRPPVVPRDAADDNDSDLGDPTALTAAEAQEKIRNKKSLKFYTSQIAQRSNRRAEAGRATGGDDDLPYRERWKERQQRIQADAENRGQQLQLPGADLDEYSGGEEESNQQRRKREQASRATGQDNDEDDYYDQVLSQHQDKKAAKAAHAAAVASAAPVRFTEDGLGVAGNKRAVSYEIKKNKGLTPKRKKEVRNPRVKKRLRYEDKMKKLGSTRPVWKGGEGRGGYGGEATGIKTGVSRGVKLS